MDSFGSIHVLSNVVIHRQARNHEGLVSIQMGKTFDDEVDGLSHDNLHGLIQVFMQSHHHPVSGCLPPGPLQTHILANKELKAPPQPRLQGVNGDLSMSLNSMSVPG